MLNVAIVEDDEKVAATIETFLLSKKEEFEITKFKNGKEFIDDFHDEFDLIYMDIEMPEIDGLSASEKVRETNKKVPIIIVSYSPKYAVKGYSVNALGYLVKPISQVDFNNLLEKALKTIQTNEDSSIFVSVKDGILKVDTNDVLYLEVKGHYLTFYFANDKDPLVVRGRIADYQDMLGKYGFSRCNECYLVNLKHVTQVLSGKNLIYLNDVSLNISRSKKKRFLSDFTTFVSEGM